MIWRRFTFAAGHSSEVLRARVAREPPARDRSALAWYESDRIVKELCGLRQLQRRREYASRGEVSLLAVASDSAALELPFASF
jgi:hypothetical protein